MLLLNKSKVVDADAASSNLVGPCAGEGRGGADEVLLNDPVRGE